MIRTSSFGVTTGEVWFDEPVDRPPPDILQYRNSKRRPAGVTIKTTLSLVSDLRPPEAALWDRIGRTHRYEIHRAESKDGAMCAMIESPSQADIDTFADFYDAFATPRSLQPADRRWMRIVADAQRLRLSQADVQGTVVARHSYIVAGDATRILTGAAHNADVDRGAVGRSHRLLHWRDMVHFRTAGIATYDWGGMFATEDTAERKGINEFKRHFGGEPVEYSEWTEATSLTGRAYLALRPMAAQLRIAFQRGHHRPMAPINGEKSAA